MKYTSEHESGILAPESFWRLGEEAYNCYCNGCGAGSALIDLVPDTIYGLRVTQV